MKRRAILLAFLLPFLAFLAPPARGEEERILLFDVTATMNADAGMAVKESLLAVFTHHRLPIAAFFVACVIVYYFRIWRIKGKDPERKQIVPLFEPPSGVEPGFARYFREEVYSAEVLASDILQLAVIGLLRFEEKEGTAWIVRTEKEPAQDEISPVLRSLLGTFFSGDSPKELPVNSNGGRKFFFAEEQLKAAYHRKASKYVSSNFRYTLSGLLLFLPMFWGMAFPGSPLIAERDLLDMLLVPLLLMFSTTVLWFFSLEVWRLARWRSNRHGKSYWIGLAFTFLIAFACARLLTNMLRTDVVLAGGFVLATLTVLFFGRIMPVRTEEGARLAEKIEGLAMYMEAAERHRLRILNPPEETPALFEKLLPYALALDAGKTWADRFSAVLENARYEPEWSSASSFGNGASSGRTQALLLLSRELSKNMRKSASSYTPPRSKFSSASSSERRSSGLGGRGSSGCGGGGGGGRGW
jgi:hypothetical protein